MTLSARLAGIPESATELPGTTLSLISRAFYTRGSAGIFTTTISTAAPIFATSCVTNSLSAALFFRASCFVAAMACDLIDAVKVRVVFPGNECPYRLPETPNAEKFPDAAAHSS